MWLWEGVVWVCGWCQGEDAVLKNNKVLLARVLQKVGASIRGAAATSATVEPPSEPVDMPSSDGSDSLQARARGGGSTVRVMIYSAGTPRLSGRVCEYEGGEVKACIIPQDCSYFELMHYLIEEKGYGPCSIRYESTTSDNCPPELVTISSQDDLDCAIHMVATSSHRAGGGGATLRLFVDECAEGEMVVGDDGYDGISLVASEDLDEIDAWIRECGEDNDLQMDATSKSPVPDEAVVGSPFDSQMEEVCNAIENMSSTTPEPQRLEQKRPTVLDLSPTAAAIEAAKRRPSPRKPIFLQKPATTTSPMAAAKATLLLNAPAASDRPREPQAVALVAGSGGSGMQDNDDHMDSDDDGDLNNEEDLMEGTIDKTELSNPRPFNRGGFGQIFVATWHEMDVAVKALPQDAARSTPSAVRSFKEEVRLLSKLRHPNIVQYLGCVRERIAVGGRERWSLVTEFIRRGSLYDVIRKTEPQRLPWRRRVEIAFGTALGMHFLHLQRILHLDLKSLNVLIANDFRPKICDFGLCRQGVASTAADSTDSSNTASGEEDDTPMGTWEWMAPEIMRGENPRRSADVYSFAIMLYELCALDIPYQHVRHKRLLLHLVGQEDMRPHIPAGCETAWSDLMTRCWARTPTERPSFKSIVCELRELRKADMSAWSLQPPPPLEE